MLRDADRPGAATHGTPPYAAFVSFDAFTRRAATEAIPAQVDKSLLINWAIAAGNESGLLTTLKSLGLIDDSGRTTELYREIRLSATRRVPALRRSIELAYPGLPAAGRSIEGDRLHDYFVEDRGLTGQMVSKAMRFYRQIVAATADDGSQLVRTAATPPPARRPQTVPPTVERVADRHPPARSSQVGTSDSSGRVRRHPTGARGALEPGVTVQVTVTPDVTEEAMTALFRRVRRAWSRSRYSE